MKHRLLVPELMDDPSLDHGLHCQALAGLRRINWICRTGHQVASEITSIASRRDLKSVSVLDLGCGSGDIAVSIAKRLFGRFDLHMEGWDISQTACNAASANAAKHLGLNGEALSDQNRFSPSIEFRQRDIFQLPENVDCAKTGKPFDFVYCCLFLHHFSDDQAVEVLANMKRLARVAVIVDDLLRSSTGLLLAKVGCYTLSRSPIVHFDGPQSVRAAFSCSEVEKLASRAGLTNVSIRRHWPQRYLLKADASQ